MNIAHVLRYFVSTFHISKIMKVLISMLVMEKQEWMNIVREGFFYCDSLHYVRSFIKINLLVNPIGLYFSCSWKEIYENAICNITLIMQVHSIVPTFSFIHVIHWHQHRLSGNSESLMWSEERECCASTARDAGIEQLTCLHISYLCSEIRIRYKMMSSSEDQSSHIRRPHKPHHHHVQDPRSSRCCWSQPSCSHQGCPDQEPAVWRVCWCCHWCWPVDHQRPHHRWDRPLCWRGE